MRTISPILHNRIPPCYDDSAPPFLPSYDLAPQYALSLGDFVGGRLCVECGPRDVAVVDTKGRMAKVDGRFPHWVSPYVGERYSVIWFTTDGPTVARSVAIFDETLEQPAVAVAAAPAGGRTWRTVTTVAEPGQPPAAVIDTLTRAHAANPKRPKLSLGV